MKQTAKIKNMNSVEWIAHYTTEIEREVPQEIPDQKPPTSLPTQGQIVRMLSWSIDRISLQYSIDMEAGEIFGIDGR